MRLWAIAALVSLSTCGLCVTLIAPAHTGAAFLGMLAPLVVGLGTILLVEQTTRKNMPALTSRMTIAFIIKMVFYAAYVWLAIIGLGVDPVAFIVSFTVYFVSLQIIEALYLKTLVARATPSSAIG